ncbi:LptF/LptG family permease [Pedomonas mirosovicensis]|uniref:LptF/LptG family permease n=1 Tax=Pedomonas mirosovicensis TaxID=2908641 RepID=UPI002168E867|nr:LptF/LptG family permease [Pedomonas mirosovicensis]MCH8684816.1 LptF/LptG family permease [Pedomonas mirosovicensis]
MFTRIDRYMGRLMIVPMVATLTIAAMLLLLERMLNLFNFVINEGGPVSVVWRMLANLMPEQFGFALPISLLLGVMMAVRTLALNSELDALLGSGVSHGRLLRVPLAIAGVLALLTVWLVGYEQPYSRYAYERLRFELQSGALGASIKVGDFAHLGDNIVMRVEGSEDGGQKLRGVFLRAEEKNYGTVVASAEQARFLATDNPDVLLLRLFRGVLVQDKTSQTAPRALSFNLHDIPINLPRLESFRARGKQLEFTLSELWSASGDPDRSAELQRQARGTLHRRLVQMAVLLPLPFLGLALAVPPKRSSTSLGIFVGIFLLLLLNEFNKAGEAAVQLGAAPPWLAIWVPFAGFCVLSAGAYWVLVRRVGGHPLSLLFMVTDRLGRLLSQVQKRLPRLGRS